MAHPKNDLLEYVQARKLGKPRYRTRNEGSAHEPVFKTEVELQGSIIGRGEGSQKRQAERQAAEAALAYLEAQENQPEAEQTDASDVSTSATELPFEGPWPIFDAVLASSLQIANSRVSAGEQGQVAIRQVRDLALELYKEVLEHLGEVVEIEGETD